MSTMEEKRREREAKRLGTLLFIILAFCALGTFFQMISLSRMRPQVDATNFSVFGAAKQIIS